MRFPTTQGTNSLTFTPVPLDGSLSVPQLLDLQLQQSPEHPVYRYDLPDGSLVTIKLGQYVKTVHQAAKILLKNLPSSNFTESPVIGLLAFGDGLSYCMTMNAAARAGIITCALSHRSTADGLADLITKTKLTCLYACSEPEVQSLLTEAFIVLERRGLQKPAVFEMLSFERLQEGLESVTLLPPMERPDLDTTAVILHSSGSTSAVCKLFPYTHRFFLNWAALPWWGGSDLCGEVMAGHTIPGFHGMGFTFTCWPFTCGLAIAFFRPCSPPIVPTPEAVIHAVAASRSTVLFCVPAALELWSKHEQGVKVLKSMKAVIWGGSTLFKDTGDRLINHGVPLIQFYGLTETGCLTSFIPQRHFGKDWQYFAWSPHCRVVLEPRADMPNVYTITIFNTPNHVVPPALCNTVVDGTPGYLINDLIERHPTNPALWRVSGRTDDVMILSSGFTINPTLMEATIVRHPQVAFAVVFGHNRTHVGVLIELKRECALVLDDATSLESTTSSMWEVVQEANEEAKIFARVAKEMIIIASPSKPFALTSKLQPRRPVVLEAYQAEINAVYEATQEMDEPAIALVLR